jgi:hypothetical protein
MSTKRKTYTTKEKDIISRVKHGDSKASLIQEFGVLEGTICGWLKEIFVDQADDKICHDRKKKKSRCRDVDKCLHTCFVQKCHEGVPISGLLQAKFAMTQCKSAQEHLVTTTVQWPKSSMRLYLR